MRDQRVAGRVVGYPQQRLGKAGVEEGLANRPVEQGAIPEKRAGGLVGEADVRLRVDEKEGVTEGVEQSVTLVTGLFEVLLEAEFPGIDFCF